MRCPAFECLYGGAVGGGKGLLNDEMVLSPFGWKQMGEVGVGDRLCATDGTVTEVIGVYPQGEVDIYSVEFSDGQKIVTDGEHNWLGHRCLKSVKIGNGRTFGEDSDQVWKTPEIMKWIESSGKRFSIPAISRPVATNVAGQFKGPGNFIGREIDPYLLGLLLGDGCMTTADGLTIASADDQIVDFLAENYDCSVYETNSKAKAVRFKGECRKKMASDLEDLGLLGHGAASKFVPRQYMMGPADVRLSVLQGLLDTDGWAEDGRAIHFSSASVDLAENVRDLCFSLGGVATCHVKTMDHIQPQYLDANCVRLKFRDPAMAFRLERKRAVASTIKHQEMRRYIERVVPAGRGSTTCLQVRHKNSLFIATGFVVTHNTDALLGDFARGIEMGSAWVGMYIRKHFPDMDDVIRRSHEIYGQVYGSQCYSGSKYQWNFPSGAILQFRALERDDDVQKYIGQQYAWLGWDELTQWASPYPYTFLMTRLRSAKGAPVRVRAATNPGGPGHSWVKARFLDPMPPGIPLQVETKSGDKYHRVFIPSKLDDNKILMQSDPGYADRIYEVGDPALARALREGNWNIVAGAAFPEFSEKDHVIDNYPIPTDRPVWRSCDWGFDTPYCNLWMFPSNEGELIVSGELYGWSGKPNVGTREAPAEVRRKIAMFEALHELYVPYGMLDNQCWEERGNPSQIVKELSGGQFDEFRLHWQPWKKGPNSRVQQKQLLHNLMAVTNGRSRIKIMRRCHHLIRTLPILPRDPRNMEDVDTGSEDHAYDALRGGAAKNVPTKDEIRRRALNRQYANMEYGNAADLVGGGF